MSEERAACRLCTAPIFWAVSDTGGTLALNFDADPQGNVVLQEDGVAYLVRGMLWEKIPQGTRYKHHNDTCPNRKRK